MIKQAKAKHKQAKVGKERAIVIFLVLFPLCCFLLTLLLGRYSISFSDIMQTILGNGDAATSQSALVLTEIRLPRALVGMLVGAALAVSGAAFQGLFCNPLVNSGILGVSSGAGFGAALAIIIWGQNSPAIIVLAFGFGCLAVCMSYVTGKVYGVTSTIMLVLGGTVVGSIFSALISFLKYVADPFDQLPAITFWLMGSLASADKTMIVLAAIPMLTGIIGIFILRWRLNILSMGDVEAKSLGVDVGKTKFLIVFFATLATAGAVCVSGVIGWIGLIIPHVARMLLGSDNKKIIPASIALGAGFMLIVDTFARTISSSEIPLGIITAILGGPFFIYLLKKTKGGGWQ